MVPGAPPPHAQPLRSSLPPAVAALLASKRAAPGGLVAYAQGQALGQKEAKAELRAQRAAGRARDAGYDSGGPRRKRQVIMDSEEEDGGSTSSEAEGGGGAAAAPRPQHAPAAPTGGGGADGDEYGEALKACAAIGARLKAKLGGTVLGGDGFGGADGRRRCALACRPSPWLTSRLRAWRGARRRATCRRRCRRPRRPSRSTRLWASTSSCCCTRRA